MTLRLSPHVLPQPRLGLHPLRPQNLTPGPDRLHYAKVAIDICAAMAKRGQLEEAKRWRDEVPFGNNLIVWRVHGDHVHVEPVPELANALSFDEEQLGILFRDGRMRNDGAMIYLPTGPTTPDVLGLVRRLHRGVEREALLADPRSEETGFDGDLVDDLIRRGAIESGAAFVPTPAKAPGIEWLGHAYVRAICPRASAWFDPFTAPRIAWTDPERTTTFQAAVPDRFLLDNYGPDAHQITQDELPDPDGIFITHQDSDHMDLGLLALVPPEVPIYVPAHDPACRWQVDLVSAMRSVLGRDRNVVEMKHDTTIELGDIKVTALPFVGEFPAALRHQWNCYYVELPDQVWLLTADSAVTSLHVDWVRARRAGDHRPLGIMTNGLAEPRPLNGYRDAFDEIVSFNRLYSWYLPPVHLFDPVPPCGLPLDVLDRFVGECGLSRVYFYAHGNLPWYRMEDTLLHRSHVGSHALGLWEAMEHAVRDHGANVLRLRHGVPHIG